MIHATIANTMHPLGISQDGDEIYVNLIQSPASAHIGRQPHMLTLAKQLLDNVALAGPAVTIEHDFGKPIGNTDVVETTAKDTIVYAKPLKQDIYTRYVKRRTLASSSFLSMSLLRDADGNYELRDIWIGRCTPPLPGSTNETSDSKRYWENHAIILEGQPLQLRTLTKDVPY